MNGKINRRKIINTTTLTATEKIILQDPIMISNIFSLLFGWLYNFWKSIPEETRDDITEAMIEAFTKIFRSFYQQNKATKEENENA